MQRGDSSSRLRYRGRQHSLDYSPSHCGAIPRCCREAGWPHQNPSLLMYSVLMGKGCGWPPGRGDGMYSSSVGVFNVAPNTLGLYWHGIEASPLPVSLQTEEVYGYHCCSLRRKALFSCLRLWHTLTRSAGRVCCPADGPSCGHHWIWSLWPYQLSVSLLSFSGDNNSVTCAHIEECFGGELFCLLFSWP